MQSQTPKSSGHGPEEKTYKVELRTRDQIHGELERVLAGHDPFWPRWVVWVERNGSKQ